MVVVAAQVASAGGTFTAVDQYGEALSTSYPLCPLRFIMPSGLYTPSCLLPLPAPPDFLRPSLYPPRAVLI